MEAFKPFHCYCPVCGSILPSIIAKGNIVCYNCKKEFNVDFFSEQEVAYTINFNTTNLTVLQNVKKVNEGADGPTVERKCSICGHGKMSYATLQLRSADEGQTVFFTCLKCKHKEAENS